MDGDVERSDKEQAEPGLEQLVNKLEAARREANAALHIAHRAPGRQELHNVLGHIGGQLGIQRDTLGVIRGQIADAVEDMKRRDFLRQVGVVGLGTATPGVMPISVVRDALTTPLPQTERVLGLPALRSAVNALWLARQHSQYDQFTNAVPGVLAALQRRNEEHGDVHGLLSLAYQAIAGSMAELQKSDIAWIAAERGIVAARQSGHATVIASAERRHAHTLSSMDRNAQAEQVALTAAGTLELSERSALSVYGALLNTCAIAAARQDKADSANAYLDEAQQAARHVGEGRNDLFTAFGPTNVALHRISVAVEAGEAGRAIQQAAAIIPDLLPPERRAHFRVDLAHAHIQAGTDDGSSAGSAINSEHLDSALTILLDAEQLAPEEIRYHPTARTLVATMARGRANEQVLALAQRIGLDADAGTAGA